MRRWFTMSAANGSAEILIYDEIGKSFWNDDALSASDFDRALRDLGEVSEITLRVNSPGGDAFDGSAIYNMLANHPATITARVDGIAASAASLVVMAANEIVMPQNTFMLIHEPSGFAFGMADDMRALASDLDRITASFAETYAARSEQPIDDVKKLLKEDRLLSAEEAVELGYADRVIENVKVTARFSMDRLPRSARERFQMALEPEERLRKIIKIEDKSDKDNVVSLDNMRTAAKRDALVYARTVMDLCRLAGKPEMAAKFVAEEKPEADVRKELVDLRAREDRETVLLSQHREPADSAQATKAGWDKAIQKVNKQISRAPDRTTH